MVLVRRINVSILKMLEKKNPGLDGASLRADSLFAGLAARTGLKAHDIARSLGSGSSLLEKNEQHLILFSL